MKLTKEQKADLKKSKKDKKWAIENGKPIKK